MVIMTWSWITKEQDVWLTDNTESLAATDGISRKCFRVAAWHVSDDSIIDGDRGTPLSMALRFAWHFIDLCDVQAHCHCFTTVIMCTHARGIWIKMKISEIHFKIYTTKYELSTQSLR